MWEGRDGGTLVSKEGKVVALLCADTIETTTRHGREEAEDSERGRNGNGSIPFFFSETEENESLSQVRCPLGTPEDIRLAVDGLLKKGAFAAAGYPWKRCGSL